MEQAQEAPQPGAAIDELALARLAAQGDESAFEQIMRRYNQRLYRLAMSVLGDAAEAEDALQESYVRAFYRLSGFAGRSGLGAWLAQIVRNESLDRLRARARRNTTVTLEAALMATEGAGASPDSWALHTPTHPSPEADVARDEMRAILERALQTLPVQFRTVFMLREVEGLSVEETAAYLDIPAATVKTRDHRARLLLRRHLTDRIDAATRTAFTFLGARCDGLVAQVMERIAP